MVNIGNDWDELLKDQWEMPYYRELRAFLKREYKERTIYPPADDIFNALKLTPYCNIKCVILGQDPYIRKNQAHGLCFSVCENPPPSLLNIYKELKNDLGIDRGTDGNLTNWAKNGVLLLNTVLTVREGESNSHKNKGWETLTDRIIELASERKSPTVFMLWGANAKAKRSIIKQEGHIILNAAHPSPLSAFNGFFGCGHFSKANKFLNDNGIGEIDWGA